MTRLLLASGVLVVALGGCAESPPVQPPVEGDVLVDYEFYSFGGATFVQVLVDGTVNRHHNAGPNELGALGRAELDDLGQKLHAADLPSAEPRYGCGGCVDDSVHVVSTRIQGVTYRVESETQTPHPARLDPLFDALHDVSTRPF